MSDAEYQRWLDIVDRETLGEPLSADDLEFRREYEQTHPECARETEAWSEMIGELIEVGRDSEDAAELEAVTARVLAAAGSRAADDDERGAGGELISLAARRPARRRLWGAMAGAAAAAGVALALWSQTWSEVQEPERVAPSLAQTDSNSPAEAGPDAGAKTRLVPAPNAAPPIVALSRGEPRAGEEAPALVRAEGGELCVRYLAPFASVCLSEGGELQLGRSPQGDRELELRAGRLVAALDPLPAGERFTVVTEAGSVTVVGTVFVVELDAEGQASVAVLEGTVEVRARAHEELLRVSAGSGLQLGARAPYSLESLDSVHVQALEWGRAWAAASALWRSPTLASVSLPAPSADAGDYEISVDSLAVGAGPVNMVLEAGDHELAWRSAGGDELRKDLSLEAGRSGRVEAELAALLAARADAERDAAAGRDDATSKPRARRRARRPTVAGLKRRARSARLAERWSEAAGHYERLIRLAPESPAAQNARVQLGELLRGQLAQPEKALAVYEAYIARGGDLIVEAHHGRILALRQLGRTADETEAIAQFLGRFPDSLFAGGLQARAEELAEEGE